MTDVKVVPKGKAYYENFNRIFNKCKHKPRFLETSLVTKPDGTVVFETLAQCETCHEQLCVPSGPVEELP